MISALAYVHPETSIGKGTQIWQFAVVLKGAVIGEDCNLNAHTLVEGEARVGNNVTLKSGVYIWNGITLEDGVFCGPNATFTNDKHPISGNKNYERLNTVVRSGASIGANAVILPGIMIGRNSTIGAGAVVTRDVPDGEIWIGNPARKHNSL
jgi:acetyltransferase-like isoleucine patch superfamily enzyme